MLILLYIHIYIYIYIHTYSHACTHVQIDRQGMYKLRFTMGGLAFAESHAFSVLVGAAARLGVLADVAAIHSTPGFPFAQQPSVVVQDAGGNRLVDDSSTAVTATLVPAGISASLVLAPGLSPTVQATSGVSYFQGLRVDASGDGYVVRFTSGNLAPAFSRAFSVSPGPAFALFVLAPPKGCRADPGTPPQAGYNCTTQPQIAIHDAGGNIVRNSSGGVVSVAVHNASGSSVSVGSASMARVQQGVATWSGFAIDTPGAGYTATFTSSNITGVVVTDINVSTTAAASLIVDWIPGVIEPGYVLPAQPRVRLVDAAGTLMQHDSSARITAHLTAGVRLGGTRVGVASEGVVQFTDLRVDLRGVCYRLTFTSGIVKTAVSRPFDVFLGFEKKIIVTRQPVGAVPGLPFQVRTRVDVCNNFCVVVACCSHVARYV
jgi:hypothetical protein